MKVLVLTILSVFFGNVFSWSGYNINMEYADLDFDESLMNLEIKMKRNGDKSVVNVRSELFEDIDDPIVVHVSHYEKVNEEFQHLVNSSASICNILSRIKSHPILRIIMKELLKASNLPSACPVKKGVYYMKDFSVNDDLLPPFLPIGTFMSKIRIARSVDDEESTMVGMTIYIDIENAKERKSFKLF